MANQYSEVSTDEEGQTAVNRNYVEELYDELRRVWANRNGEYLMSRNAYIGDQWEGLGNAKPGLNRYGLTINYTKPIADKDVQILMGELPGIMVKPPSAEQAGRALAEQLEGVLYGNWELNDAHLQLLNAAFHSVVLRRGIIYLWWDPDENHVMWKSCVPENFYPAYDGDEVFECIYVTRRLTRALKMEYPQYSADITGDDNSDLAMPSQARPVSEVQGGVTDALSLREGYGDYNLEDRPEGPGLGYTTVIDYYNRDGEWARMMGNAFHYQKLDLPFKGVPFLEFKNSVVGDEREPENSIDQVVELNKYYNELFSQKADIIAKTADPPVIDVGSGVPAAKLQTHLAGESSIIPIRPDGDLRYLVWPQGSLPDIEGHLEETLNAMHDLSGKPRSSFGQTITNQSGIATNMALTPTLQSNELRQTIWGAELATLNTWILMTYEAKSKGKPISFPGGRVIRRTRKGAATQSFPLQVNIKGSDINGWYRNKIQWPSAIRVDDPVYLDGVIKQLANSPQLISIFDAHEMLGYEDSEAMSDRIAAEHEDPRHHPEILEQTVASLQGLAGLNDPDAAGLTQDIEEVPGGEQGLTEGEVLNQTAQPLPPEGV